MMRTGRPVFGRYTTVLVGPLTDTGRRDVTGPWSDLVRFKTPTLRALAARTPCFHNGIAGAPTTCRSPRLHRRFANRGGCRSKISQPR